jgi:PEGA domain
MRRALAAAAAIAALWLVTGCFPKGQTYGVGNVGGLVFAVNPPDAEVVLDGVIQGKASEYPEDRYLKVDSGTHRLELRAAGYETYSRDIYVSSSLLRIEETLVMKGGAGRPTTP